MTAAGNRTTADNAAMIPMKSAETEVGPTLPADSTWYGMQSGTTTVNTLTPDDFDSSWDSNARCKAVFKVDLSNMESGDTINIEILEKVHTSGSFQRRAYYSYTGAQTTDIIVLEVEVSSYGIQARIQQTGGTGRTVYIQSYAYQGQDGL